MKATKFKQTEIGLISEDWEVEQLQKISRVIDSCHKTPKYSPKGIAMVRVTDIKYGGLDLTNTLKVSKEVYEEFTLNHKPKKNDIVMSRVGTYGISSFVNTDKIFCLGQNTVVIHPSLNSRFIYYSLNSKLVKKQIEEEVTGSTQKTISLKDIRELLIAFPKNELELQLIAKILSDLDSKIELNQQMNKTLEAIGQAIFKHWFVDFEFPNEKGKPYKSSGGEIVESELGEIPKGWKVGNVLNEFNLTMGQSPPGSTYNEMAEGISFFQGRTDFGFRFPTKRIFCTSPSRFAEPGDTLVSVRAPVGDINMATENCCIGRGVAGIKHKTGSRSYTYYSMYNLRESFLHFEAEGTVFGSIGKTDFEKIRIVIPSKEIVNLFEKMVYYIDQKIENNFLNVKSLSQIRDSLLPGLISGKIRVPVEVKA